MIALLIALTTAHAAEELVWDTAVDLPITLSTGSIFAALYLGAERQDLPDATGEEPGGIDALSPHEIHRGPDRASNVLMFGSIGLGAAVAVVDGMGENPGPRLGLYLEAFAINGAVTEITKYAVRRPRPYTFGGTREGGAEDDKSFFSGHTSTVAVTTFTTARAVDLSNDVSPWARASLYGSASILTLATAALRIAAGKHFPSDVIVGAIVGTSVGFLVPELHRESRMQVSGWTSTRGTTLFAVGGSW